MSARRLTGGGPVRLEPNRHLLDTRSHARHHRLHGPLQGTRMNRLLRPLALTLALTSTLLPTLVGAQDRIYRCGNEYTNNATQAKERGCRLVEGGNVTVLSAPPIRASASKSTGGTSASSSATSPSSAPKVTSNDQRARDADARAILEAELRKAQARQAELSKEYNNGAPDRTIQERTNPLLYTRRVDELKEALARTESDIAGIQREISRLPQVAP